MSPDEFASGVFALIVFLLILYFWYDPYGPYNSRSVRENITGGQEVTVRVHNKHPDSDIAAQTLAEINRRIEKLMNSLQSQYSGTPGGFNPDKKNYIDVINSSDIVGFGAGNPKNEYIQERIAQLLKNYDPGNITEISPLNKSGNTSYTLNKSKLVLCLRSKTPDASGVYPVHDINTIMFVVLHELAHMMNNNWGHGPDFWNLFRFLIKKASEIGIYTPVDYSRYPVEYCGMRITSSP